LGGGPALDRQPRPARADLTVPMTEDAPKPSLLAVRAVAVWLVLIAGETVNGIVRVALVAPVTGDLAARQLGVMSGSVIVLVIAIVTCGWLGTRTARSQVAVGLAWVALTIAFEVALGWLLGYSRERIGLDYDLTRGGLLTLGLIIMALAPALASLLRAGRSNQAMAGNDARSDPAEHGWGVAAITGALGLFALWTAVTWLLEGRIGTLLRPEAAADRLVYSLGANILVGTAAAVVVLGVLAGRRRDNLRLAGFAGSAPSIALVAVAVVAGAGPYLLQDPPTLDPVVVVNAYAQVLPVSLAEVIVCWGLVGATVESRLRPHTRLAWVAAAVVSSATFGLYHFAHSPPFNTLAMVAFLTLIGFVTSGFFLISRDLYATVVFHSFLGMTGVVEALHAAGGLTLLAEPNLPLLGTAVLALLVLALLDRRVLRRSGSSSVDPGVQPRP
jgi:hypothetical protein